MRFFFKPETTKRGVKKMSSCDGGKRAVVNLSSFVEGSKVGEKEACFGNPCQDHAPRTWIVEQGKGKVGTPCRERP